MARSQVELAITGEPWRLEYSREDDLGEGGGIFTGRVLDKDGKLVFTMSPEKTPLEGSVIANRIKMLMNIIPWANNADIEAGLIETTARYPIKDRKNR